MINSPGYLGQMPGMSIAGREYPTGEAQASNDPAFAKQKSIAEKSIRSQEICDIARQCEYMRQRLLVLDLQDDADCMDGIIGHLMDRWNRERRR